MNEALLAARRRFKGQTASIETPIFDNSPFVEGVHTFEIAESKLKETTRQGRTFPSHYMRLRCIAGDDANKSIFPFAPALDQLEGIVAAAANIQRILGDVIPGYKNTKGEFEVDVPAFLEMFDDLAAQCIGETVEAKVVNTKNMRDDGTPWQSVFINRGLGEDGKQQAQPIERRSSHTPEGNLSFSRAPAKKPAKKRAPAKRKVAKRKAAKKKRR
jgi:hypothetical protein